MESQNEYQSFSDFRHTFVAMKSVVIIGLLLLSFLSRTALAQEQQVVVPYTLADRDRAINLEARITGLEEKMELRFEGVQERFDGVQNQFDDLKGLFYWGFGIFFSLFVFMLGYMIWDRRTAMKPALQQASKAMEDNRRLLSSLRDYSKKHPDLADILRSHGIL